MCRIYQGFVFRCPAEPGGCDDTFVQVQQQWFETVFVNMFFDRAAAVLLKESRKLVEAKTDPKTLSKRAKRGKEKAATPAVSEEVELRTYCRMLLHEDLWKEMRNEGLATVRKAIGAVDGGIEDEYCPNKETTAFGIISMAEHSPSTAFGAQKD